MTRALLMAALLVLAFAVPAGAAEPRSPYVVLLGAGAEPPGAGIEALEREGGFRAERRYGAALHGFAATLTDAQAAGLRRRPDVLSVAPDATFTGAAMTPTVAGETVPAGIRRIRAATTTQVHAAADAAVAVVDTGLDLPNPDLAVAGGVNCVTTGAAAQDDHGHGTHIGGTLAGRNSGRGVAGVAPGTRLYAVKVLNAKNSGTLSQFLCGLDWLARNAQALGIRVANVSMSGGGKDDGACGRVNGDALHVAICNVTAAGVTVVASAGNAKTAIGGAIPAAYGEVLTVTAMTDTDGAPGGRGAGACVRGEVDDTPWTGSNFGTTAADVAHLVAAPGTCIVSAARGGGTATMTGTSMAAPHVAGTVALCIGNGGVPGACAGLTPAQTIARIRSDADAAAGAGFGFKGDLRTPVTGKHFGDLVSAAAY